MNRIPNSIIHVVGFFLSVCLMVVLFAKTTIIGANGGINTIIALFHFKHQNNLSCEAIDISKLPTSIKKNASYSCNQTSCNIDISEYPNGQIINTFKAINNDAVTVIDIDKFFYDENREIISYATKTDDLSSRIVMNFEGELIQSIDESPGENRILSLIGYQPDTGMLVYQDTKSNYRYFYSVDSIYFARRRCP